jgi:hypothetical protein
VRGAKEMVIKIAVISMFAGAVLVSLIEIVKRLKILRNKLEVEAKVVKSRKECDIYISPVCYFVLAYIVDGKSYETDFIRLPPENEERASVNIICNKNKPSDYMIVESAGSSLQYPIASLVTFLVFIVATILS